MTSATQSSALLLLLLDSRSPAGAHGHSGGMEAAVTAGFVTGAADVERFCRFRLRTAGQAAAAFAATACQLWRGGFRPEPGGDPAWWAELDAEFSARVPSAAARAASRQLGSGLRRLVRAMAPEADLAAPWRRIQRPAPHHPLVLGAAVAIAGGDPRLAGLAAALGTCIGPASAAVRLLGLDPYAVQGVLAGLSPEIDATGVTGARFATAHAGIPQFADLPALTAGIAAVLMGGALAVARTVRSPGRVITLSMLGACGGLIAFAQTPDLAVAFALLGLASLAITSAQVHLVTRIQQVTPDHLRGAISGLSAIAQSGLAGVAAACMALTAASFGARTIIIAVAAGAALVSLRSGRRASERQSHPAS